MAPPARTITVALDMSKAFDTINIHTIIRKLLHTRIPCTIMKFIVSCIKEHKAYTTYRNQTLMQRQFKTGVLQGGILSSTLFNIYTLQTYYHPEHRFRSCLMQATSPLHLHESSLELKINNTTLCMATHPKVLGLTQNLHTAHTFTTSQYTHTILYKS